jgi:hypothetical protein
MTNFRMMLLGTAAIGLTAAAMAPASAGEVEKTTGFGGHVNRAVTFVDDGDNTTMNHEDNSASMSRFKLWGEAKSESLTTKAYIEARARGGQDAQGAGDTASALSIRHSYLKLSNNMGSLTMGETDPAGDGGMTASLSGAAGYGTYVGTSVVGNHSHIVTGAGATNGTQGSLATTGNDLSDYTQGRRGTLRYDSPDFNGFSFAAGTSVGAQNGVEAAYSADFDGTEVVVQIAHHNTAANSTTVQDTTAGSVAVKLASGLNAAVGYGQQDKNSGNTNKDADNIYVELGYDASVFDMGGTSVMANWQRIEDATTTGDSTKMLSLNVVQSLSDYGTTVYAGLTQMQYDTAAANYEDITAGWVGVKVAF